MTALLSNLSKMDKWLLARCCVGYRAEPLHLKEASPGVVKLLTYLDGISFNSRALVISQQVDIESYSKIVATDPESKSPSLHDLGRNWTIIHASELKNLPPVEWLVRGEIPRGGLVVLFGKSGAGKSFVALDYALSLAQGDKVVYIAAEGEWGYHYRVEAWTKHHKKSVGGLYMCLGAVNLSDHTDVEAFMERIATFQPVLVVIDTLAMSMAGADENATRDMQMIVATCKRVQRDMSAAVMLVHHVNKGGIAERGSGVLRGAADIMIKVSPQDDIVAVESDKSKDLAPFPTRYIKLLPVPLGFDKDGQEITSVVVVPTDQLLRTKDDEITHNQRKVLEALALEALENGGSLVDVTEITELNKGSVWKILSRLISMEHVEKAGANYRLTERGRGVIGVAAVAAVAPVAAVALVATENPDRAVKSDATSATSATSATTTNDDEDDSPQLTFDEMKNVQQKRIPNQYERGY